MGGFRDRDSVVSLIWPERPQKSNKHLSDSSCHSWMFFPRILSKLLLRILSQTHPSISIRFDLEKHPIKYSKLREQPQNHQWVRIGNDMPCKSQWSWGMETYGFMRNVFFPFWFQHHLATISPTNWHRESNVFGWRIWSWVVKIVSPKHLQLFFPTLRFFLDFLSHFGCWRLQTMDQISHQNLGGFAY